MIRALLVLVVTAITAISPDYSGRWVGSIRVISCRRVTGTGSDYCRFRRGSTFPARLRLQQDSASISGQIEVDDTLGRPHSVGVVLGSSTASGLLVLRGDWRTMERAENNVHLLREWSTMVDDSGQMTGTFKTEHKMTNHFGPQVGEEEYELVKMLRSVR